MRAGATRKTAKKILKKVRSQIYQDMSTGDIYKKVLHAISEEKGLRALYQRYQLKDAIMRLGPAGFAFENYIESILEHYNLQPLKVRTKIKGKCAIHEIDVIGKSESKLFLI